MEIVFSVYQENDGGFVAECLSYDIFTQANSWEELRANVQDAVTGYFFDQAKPIKFGYTSCGTKFSPAHETSP
ncbi:MAG: hypothetical protein QOH71_527 [Blastocatellia bacterium]|jgi:predicted RNase H-like HicB family nuclease|nr:hypothetical protein [Blastocatellia bacterium]